MIKANQPAIVKNKGLEWVLKSYQFLRSLLKENLVDCPRIL